jgi:hypothetical protein
MYDRQIEVKTGLVFITENDYVEMDVSLLPADVAFYVEYEGDWWVERKPFAGREKNEDVRHIALKILAEAEKLWAEQQKIFEEINKREPQPIPVTEE